MSCHIPVTLSPTPLPTESLPRPPSELCIGTALARGAAILNMTGLLGRVPVLAGKSPHRICVCNPHIPSPAPHTLVAHGILE